MEYNKEDTKEDNKKEFNETTIIPNINSYSDEENNDNSDGDGEVIRKSGKIDRSRSKKKKVQSNNRKNDRKNKMDRNEYGYGEEV